ncbi:hypothetical protein STEG23_017269, partial [Scotinomys teguina]
MINSNMEDALQIHVSVLHLLCTLDVMSGGEKRRKRKRERSSFKELAYATMGLESLTKTKDWIFRILEIHFTYQLQIPLFPPPALPTSPYPNEPPPIPSYKK